MRKTTITRSDQISKLQQTYCKYLFLTKKLYVKAIGTHWAKVLTSLLDQYLDTYQGLNILEPRAGMLFITTEYFYYSSAVQLY